TTQETAWAVMALTDWMVVSGELRPNYEFSVTLNGEQLTEGQATPENVRESEVLSVQVAELLKDEANRLVLSRTDGYGAVWYAAHLRAALRLPVVEVLDLVIFVDARYTVFGDDMQTPIAEALVGQVVQVLRTIIAPIDLHYVVI